jgi:hypothetical protein
LQHEWREEQSRVLGKLARTGIFALGALITLQLICAFVLIAFWETPYRLYAAGALVLLFGGITGMAWRGMQGKERSRQTGVRQHASPSSTRIARYLERLAELRDEAAAKPEQRSAPTAAPVAANQPLPPEAMRHSGAAPANAVRP